MAGCVAVWLAVWLRGWLCGCVAGFFALLASPLPLPMVMSAVVGGVCFFFCSAGALHAVCLAFVVLAARCGESVSGEEAEGAREKRNMVRGRAAPFL